MQQRTLHRTRHKSPTADSDMPSAMSPNEHLATLSKATFGFLNSARVRFSITVPYKIRWVSCSHHSCRPLAVGIPRLLRTTKHYKKHPTKHTRAEKIVYFTIRQVWGQLQCCADFSLVKGHPRVSSSSSTSPEGQEESFQGLACHVQGSQAKVSHPINDSVSNDHNAYKRKTTFQSWNGRGTCISMESVPVPSHPQYHKQLKRATIKLVNQHWAQQSPFWCTAEITMRIQSELLRFVPILGVW